MNDLVTQTDKEAEFDIMFGQGISKAGDVLDLAVKENIIEKSGAWFSYEDQRLGQGRENVKQYMLDNPAFLNEVEVKVREKLLPNAGVISASEKTFDKE